MTGFTLWFTGWSGSGKTTLSKMVEEELISRNMKHVQRLDGDIVRKDLTADLGFSKKDRDENIRRITFVAQLLSLNGVATLVSFISPYREAREKARERCANFIEIYVRCDREILIKRDVKGLYEKALRGEIENFTGISDPYEEPVAPEITIDSGIQTLENSVSEILSYLESRELVPQSSQELSRL